MEVLIVSKTHMHSGACVGGLVLANNSNIRLLNPGNYNQPANTSFEVGQVWDLDFTPRRPSPLPHIEDVVVQARTYVRNIPNIAKLIRQRNLIDWTGSIDDTFDELLQWTPRGSGYISPEELPERSVGFWVSDGALGQYTSFNKTRYRYSGNRNMPFVGFQESQEEIPAGTIIRLSLGRVYELNGINGYWLQLSGWY